MKNYLDLIPILGKVHRRQSRMVRICIILSVFLVTVIFGMADMEIRSQNIQAKRNYGEWHVGIRNVSDEQVQLLSLRPKVESCTRYDTLNYRLSMDYEIAGRKAVIAGFDESALAIFSTIEFLDGEFPERGGVLIDEGMQKSQNLKVGDPVVLTCPDGTKRDYRVSGIIKQLPMLAEKDVCGLCMNIEDFRTLSLEGAQDNHDSLVYVKFSPWCNIRKEIRLIREQFGFSGEQVGGNEMLLATMGQSSDVSMLAIYGIAFLLAVLVAIAGVLMITSSLNSNIAQRTEFFGLLRCLGASGEQVVRFVRRQALDWCRTAIPAGALAGMVVVWILCAVLRFLSPTYFADLPGFGISWIGLVCGSLLGIATVLLSAASPARKASKVSPLTAVSGNAWDRAPVRRAADTRRCHVEAALGFHHAMGNRKNFVLMTCSFAFSIILFLAFTVTIDFMHHAVTPLSPSSPDLSIVSSDNTCSLEEGLAGKFEELEGVKRVYGRRFAYDVPVETGAGQESVYLISYEEHQFAWAQDSLVEGSVRDTADGNGVLAVYRPQAAGGSADHASGLKTGDLIRADIAGTTQQLAVTGVLSECPFNSDNGQWILICSEDTFTKLTGERGYTIMDLQLTRDAGEDTVEEIRRLAGENAVFSDRRMRNAEVKGAVYSFAVFVYGFLAVIALISAVNIMNSIAMSVSARLREYGAMRAVGMDGGQMLWMITAEAAAYGLWGIFLGCGIGILLNRFIYEQMVTLRWGTPWYFPALPLLIIVLVIALSLLSAVYGPARRIEEMSVVDVIADR